MNEDEAIKLINDIKKEYGTMDALGEYVTAIETILAELEKKDKIIELMIKHLCDVIYSDDNASLLPFYNSDDNLEEKVKKYFERKVKDE